MTTKQLHVAIRAFEEQLQRMRRKMQLVEAAKTGKADVVRIQVRATKVQAHKRAAYTYLRFTRRAA